MYHCGKFGLVVVCRLCRGDHGSAIFAASREMVDHGTRQVVLGRMYLGVPMLYIVGFQQSPQTEDVAELVFLLGLILRVWI